MAFRAKGVLTRYRRRRPSEQRSRLTGTGDDARRCRHDFHLGPRIVTETATGEPLEKCHHGCMKTVYEAVGGADGLLALARAWHARVMVDEVVSHAFSHGYHPAHTERLAAYWAEALGGPSVFGGLR